MWNLTEVNKNNNLGKREISQVARSLCIFKLLTGIILYLNDFSALSICKSSILRIIATTWKQVSVQEIASVFLKCLNLFTDHTYNADYVHVYVRVYIRKYVSHYHVGTEYVYGSPILVVFSQMLRETIIVKRVMRCIHPARWIIFVRSALYAKSFRAYGRELSRRYY